MSLTPGILRKGEGIDEVHWNILGQVYTPKSVTPECFSWHALLPAESFVPLHVHPKQDEYIHVRSGALDLVLNNKPMHAEEGDLVCLSRGIPHGIFNNTGVDVTCLFWVTPTGKLHDLFRKMHNMARPDEVVAISPDYDVNFLPPQRAADVMDLR